MPRMSPLLYLRWLGRKLNFSNDNIDRVQTTKAIRDGIEFTGVNLWVLVIAIFMASLGLNVNSTAVIIGAMLISPLMGPIMGVGLGLGIYDLGMVRSAFRSWVAAFVISFFTSFLYFMVSPLKSAGSELLARTQPTIYDVLIAFAGGLAGILAGSSKLRQSNVIPGVAIATALMPPICTAGYSLANGRWADMAGALYLFIINSVFISLATYLVVRLLNFPLRSFVDEQQHRRFRTIATTIAVLVIAPSIYLTYNLVKRYLYSERTERFVKAEFPSEDRYILRNQLSFAQGVPRLTLTVLGRPLDSVAIDVMEKRMPVYGLEDCELKIEQGFQDSSRQTVLFDRFNQMLQVNSSAISNSYKILDTLRQKLAVHSLEDSLQVQLARESKALMPDLKSFYIGRDLYYSVDSARFDTIVHVYASFGTMPNEDVEKTYVQWLKTRLRRPILLFEKKLENSTQ